MFRNDGVPYLFFPSFLCSLSSFLRSFYFSRDSLVPARCLKRASLYRILYNNRRITRKKRVGRLMNLLIVCEYEDTREFMVFLIRDFNF